MNFQEAFGELRSGKSIRRECWLNHEYCIHFGLLHNEDTFSIDDINANDWELFEEKVEMQSTSIEEMRKKWIEIGIQYACQNLVVLANKNNAADCLVNKFFEEEGK